MALCLATSIYLGTGWYRLQRSVARIRANAQRARVFMDGLSKAIELQLTAWGLSEGERTTALFLPNTDATGDADPGDADAAMGPHH
jgi:hypothetical protein